ncbi:MAG: DUF1194 domain-containing protein [Pseudomonadota bacterium]
MTLAGPVAASQDGPVDLELALGIDVSGSVDDDEAMLQRQGYIAAFRHPDVIRAIEQGILGRIAVAYYEWAGYGHMRIITDWTLIDGAEAAHAFAGSLELNPPQTAYRTAIASAIDFAVTYFDVNDFEGTRRVVDISGDGANNWGGLVTAARDLAVAQGVIINGLPIVNDRPGPSGRPQTSNLDLYYENCVIGGPGAFLVVANSFPEFAEAVRRKLIIEIADLAPGHERALIPVQFTPNRIAPPCDIGERRWEDEGDF